MVGLDARPRRRGDDSSVSRALRYAASFLTELRSEGDALREACDEAERPEAANFRERAQLVALLAATRNGLAPEGAPDGEAIHISGSLTLGGDQDQHSKKQLRTYAGRLSGAPAVAVGLQQCGCMCWQIL